MPCNNATIEDSLRRVLVEQVIGTLYPLEVYMLIGNVDGITRGVYKYKPNEHELLKVREQDVRDKLTF